MEILSHSHISVTALLISNFAHRLAHGNFCNTCVFITCSQHVPASYRSQTNSIMDYTQIGTALP